MTHSALGTFTSPRRSAGRLLRGFALGLALVAPALPIRPVLATEPQRYVIGLHDFAGVRNASSFADHAIVRRSENLRFVSVDTTDVPGLLRKAENDPNVRYIEPAGHATVDDEVHVEPDLLAPPPYPDYTYESSTSEGYSVEEEVSLAYTPDDTYYAGYQYGPQQIGAPYAWDTTQGDTGAAVCVIDSGVRRSHEDIGTARWLGWTDVLNGQTTPYDNFGHGTHVAGIAAATIDNGKGIAGVGNVGIFAAKAMASNGDITTDNAATAIEWCADRSHARVVINMSFSFANASNVLQDAIIYAHDTKDRILVSGTGNGACSNCVQYPGAYDGRVIAVTCTTSTQASCALTSKGPQASLAAPGDNIVSTYNASDTQYMFMSGTSMSAPHVSGALALAWSYNTGMTNITLRDRAEDTARDLGTAGHDNTFGHGRVDAKCLVSPTTYPPRSVTVAAGPGAGDLKIDWLTPSFNCNRSVTGYEVLRATSAGGTYSVIASLGSAARSYTDDGLGNGTTRYYRVRATNSAGDSRGSVVRSATTFSTPSAPQNANALPGTSVGSIAVTWTAPSSTGGTPVTGYRVFRATSSGGTYTQVASVGASTTTWTDNGRPPATPFWYKIAAVNIAGEGAKSSSTCSQAFPSAPGLC